MNNKKAVIYVAYVILKVLASTILVDVYIITVMKGTPSSILFAM